MRYYDLELTPTTGKTYASQNEDETRIPSTDESVAIYFQSVDLVKYDRYFDESGYPKLKEYALQEDGTRYTYYNDEPDDDGIYQPNTTLETAEELQATYKTEYQWAKDELENSDIALNKVLDEDENAIGTESDWRTYRKALRAYCSYDSETDTYSVNDISNTYAVDSETGRPVEPTN